MLILHRGYGMGSHLDSYSHGQSRISRNY